MRNWRWCGRRRARHKSAAETRRASLELLVLVQQEHSARYKGAEAMDQQDKDALERATDRGASKEHLTISDEDDFDLILLGPMEERQGSTPGNVRIRVTLPRHQPFHRIKEGVLEATEAAGVPEGSLAQALNWLKRVLIGAPIASVQAEGERLSKFKPLPSLSPDSSSSVSFPTNPTLTHPAPNVALHPP